MLATLLPQARRVCHKRIDRGSGLVRTVVHCIDDAEGVFRRKSMIDSRGAEIFPDGLQRIVNA